MICLTPDHIAGTARSRNPGECRRGLRPAPAGRSSTALRRLASTALLAGTSLVLAAPAGPAGTTDPDVVFEAEFCRDLTYPWQPVAVAGAAGGYALAVPEGTGSSEAFAPGQGGRARFALPAARTGGGRDLWLRVRWNGNCSNSLFARCGPSGRPLIVADHVMGSWHWVRVAGADDGSGAGLLVLENREDGVWLDQLCLRPSGSAPPEGALEATTPWPPAEAGLPSVSVTVRSAGSGVEALPPTEYLLHHAQKLREPMSRQPVVVLFPGRETGLDVWLRRNLAQAGPARVSLNGAGTILAVPQPPQQVGSGDASLERRTFVLRAHPELPRGLSRLVCRVETADGLEQVHPLRVLRPYRWLVSEPFRLNPAAGLDQMAERDQALLADPLATDHGIRWRAAEPEDFTPFGLLNLRRLVSERPFSQAYAFARITAPQAGPAWLDVTHDDWIRVWLNGACVFSSEEALPSTLSRARVPLLLREGGNDVLVRSCQLKNYWEFGLVVEPVAPSAPSADITGVPRGVEAAAPPLESLPPWSLEQLVQALPALISRSVPGSAWQAVTAICREAPLVPVQAWFQWVPSLRHELRSTDDRLHGTAALLELRRRAEAGDLSNADRARLVTLTFRERSALLAAAMRPVEAAEEMAGAAVWTDSLAEKRYLHEEAVRLFLSGDVPAEAAAYLEVCGAEVGNAAGLRAVVALYGGDLETAAACYGQPAADLAARHAGWLLRLGRAAEAEWLLRRVPVLPPALRVTLAQACTEQQRFAEAEALLSECLLDEPVPRSGWEQAGLELAALHAARCSLHDASDRFRQDLERLSHHAESRRQRLLYVLTRLQREAGEPVAALRAAVAEADATAQGYRALPRPLLDVTALRAGTSLLEARRYADLIELCNDVQAVSPSLQPQLDVWRFQALVALGRPAAAAAVLASLRSAVSREPAQVRIILDRLVISDDTAAAAELLASMVLDGQPGPELASAAAVTLACAAAALGQYDRTVHELERALTLRSGSSQNAGTQADLCRPWVAQSLQLADDNEALSVAFLASPVAALRTATVALSSRPDTAAADPATAMPPMGAPPPAPVPAAGTTFATAIRRLLGRVLPSPVAPPLPPVFAAGPEAALAHPTGDIEPGTPARRWVTSPGTFPRCITLDPQGASTCFAEALRVFGEPPPVGHTVVFLQGLVWVGTDRGVFCYRRDADRWDRLHLPDMPADTPVTSLEARRGMLCVGWTSMAGEAQIGSYDPTGATWTVAAGPPAPRSRQH